MLIYLKLYTNSNKGPSLMGYNAMKFIKFSRSLKEENLAD
jgi:hypothetical protein